MIIMLYIADISHFETKIAHRQQTYGDKQHDYFLDKRECDHLE